MSAAVIAIVAEHLADRLYGFSLGVALCALIWWAAR